MLFCLSATVLQQLIFCTPLINVIHPIIFLFWTQRYNSFPHRFLDLFTSNWSGAPHWQNINGEASRSSIKELQCGIQNKNILGKSHFFILYIHQFILFSTQPEGHLSNMTREHTASLSNFSSSFFSMPVASMESFSEVICHGVAFFDCYSSRGENRQVTNLHVPSEGMRCILGGMAEEELLCCGWLPHYGPP